MRRNFKNKNKRGITLVSLVVTIIVLLILAGITINLIIGEDGIIRRAQQAGRNYIDAAENEKLQLGQFTNEMNNIIGGSTISIGREPYNSEFRKNVVEAIKNAGVATTENDTDETIVTNIGKILQEVTKDATATEEDIAKGKTAWVNGTKLTGTMEDKGTLNWAPTTSTTYTVPAGYYSGGTLNSAGAYNAGYNAGVAAGSGKYKYFRTSLVISGGDWYNCMAFLQGSKDGVNWSNLKSVELPASPSSASSATYTN